VPPTFSSAEEDVNDASVSKAHNDHRRSASASLKDPNNDLEEEELRVRRAPSTRRLRRPFKNRNTQKVEYFLSTTAFVHGDTFFGLGRTTSGILFGYFAALYAVYVLSTTLLLFVRRKDPSLSKFPVLVTHVLPAVLNGYIVVIGFVRHMFRARFPCFIMLWTFSLVIPMYVVIIFEARSLHLIFEYHWSKRMQALLHATESSTVAQSSAPYIDSALQKTVLTQPEFRRVELQVRSNSPQPTVVHDPRDWYWMKKHGMTTVVWAIFAFQFIITLGIQIFSPYYRIWPKMDIYRCAGSFETKFPFYSLCLYLFIVPSYLSIQLRRINDSYGVRQDLFNALTQSAWLFIVIGLRYVYFIEQFVGYLPTGFAIMAGFGLLHYHSVCAPLMRVYTWQWSRSRKPRKMRQLMAWKHRLESWLFPRVMRIGKTTVSGKGNCTRSKRRPHELKRLSAHRLAPATPPPAIIDAEALVTSKPKRTAVSLFMEHFGQALSFNSSVNIPSNAPSIFSAASPAENQPSASPSPVPLNTDMQLPIFSQVLQDDHLCELFERYTLLEFSRENLLFYRAVCQLRTAYSALPHGASQIFLAEKSRSIHAQFIKQAAPAEINIPGSLRCKIEECLAGMDINIRIFDEAQKEVFKLMQNWSFPRFLRTLPEEEIRRFNRRQQRRSSFAAESGPDGISDVTTLPMRTPSNFNSGRRHSISTALNTTSSAALNIRDHTEFHSCISPISAESMGSLSTLAMPSHIAFVSLSSSP